MQANDAYSINILLLDGVPEGLRKVEISGWSGVGFAFARTDLALARKRAELGQPGVYVLEGSQDESTQQIYVGEAGSLADRLKTHAVEKDFWTRAITFSSHGSQLTKAHVLYLESKLVDLAREAKRATVENKGKTSVPAMPEGEVAFVNGFLARMLVLYRILGVDAFEVPTAKAMGDSPRLSLGTSAQGYDTADGFVVLKGSTAKADAHPSFQAWLKTLRDRLVSDKVLGASADGYVFLQDYSFSSPSAASAIIVGRSSNGREAWKNADGQTLKQLQDAAASGTL